MPENSSAGADLSIEQLLQRIAAAGYQICFSAVVSEAWRVPLWGKLDIRFEAPGADHAPRAFREQMAEMSEGVPPDGPVVWHLDFNRGDSLQQALLTFYRKFCQQKIAS